MGGCVDLHHLFGPQPFAFEQSHQGLSADEIGMSHLAEARQYALDEVANYGEDSRMSVDADDNLSAGAP